MLLFLRKSSLQSCRQALLAALLSGISLAAGAAPAPTHTLAVMDFELINDINEYDNAAMHAAQTQRLKQAGDELRKQLAERNLYRIVDITPAAPLIDTLRARESQGLLNCNGCELEVGRKLNADEIALCWVQKVSNLILNVNIKVENVRTGAIVYERSVDIRGNTDLSWKRGVDALVTHIADSGQNTQ